MTAPPLANQSSRPASWALVTGVVSALAAMATVLLHFVGMVTHHHYLSFWGLDAGLFPKATDWVLMNGYYALFERFAFALKLIWAQLLILPLIAAAVALYVSFLLGPSDLGAESVVRLIGKAPSRARGFLRRAFVVFVCLLLFPAVLFAVTAFMAAPALIGETAGISIAEKHANEFKAGCTKRDRRCVELYRNGAAFAKGYLLDSSTSHIAIFDVSLQRARALSRDGIEVIAVSQ
jgi:hypothetical protein